MLYPKITNLVTTGAAISISHISSVVSLYLNPKTNSLPMKLRLFTLTVIIAVLLSTASNVFTNSAQPPVGGNTGAPGETTCAKSGCHSTNSAISTSALVFDTAPAGGLASGYTPGQQYNLIVNVNSLTPPTGTITPKYGFSLTAVDGANNAAGTFAITSASTTSLSTFSGKTYMGHKSANSTAAWVFKWTAPGSGTGNVTFYIAANSSNNDSTSSGDNIFIRNVTISEVASACTGTFTADINVSNAGPYCDGDQVTLTAVASGTGMSGGSLNYNWSNGGATPTVTVPTGTTYSLTITDGACIDTETIDLSNVTPAVASFSATVDSLTVTLTSNTTGNVATASIDLGDGSQVNPTSTTVTHTYADTGTYTVVLTIVDECGNTTTDTEIVNIDGESGPISSVVELGLANTVSIYPNPLTNNATIDLSQLPQVTYNMVVLDIMGRVVIKTELLGGQANRIAGIAEVQSGTYIYQLRTLEGKTIKNGTLLKR